MTLALPAPELLVPILTIALLAGMIQGLSGFGSALVAVPLLALVLPVETVVPLMALLGMTISGYNLLHLRHAVRVAPVRRLLGGYLMGTPIGLYALKQAPESALLGALGLFLCGYALLALSGRQPRANWLREWRVGLGAVSGALGAAFSTNGPPVILHVAAHPEWDADRQKATLVLYFLLASGITVIAHSLSGFVSNEVVTLYLCCVPLLIIGTQLGVRFYRRLGPHNYRRLTFLLILLTGVMLVARVLPELGRGRAGDPHEIESRKAGSPLGGTLSVATGARRVPDRSRI